MRRAMLIAVSIMLGMAFLLPQAITAQNGDADSAATSKDYRGPLPSHYGKLGMSDAQKDKAYSILESYEEQIEKLRKQIEEIEAKRETEVATILTPGQKLRLQELREEAAKEAAQAEAKAGGTSPGDSVVPKSE